LSLEVFKQGVGQKNPGKRWEALWMRGIPKVLGQGGERRNFASGALRNFLAL
jgi:hypothetical protein